MTPFETWLKQATRGLAPESVARISAEIGDHYESALSAGTTPAQAVATLGDPAEANRGYRRVFLTEREALLATAFTQPTRSRQALWIQTIFLATLIWFLVVRTPTGNTAVIWAVRVLIWIDLPFRLLYLPNTKERSRQYLVWGLIRVGTLAFLFSWDSGWPASLLSLSLLPFVYLDYQRWMIFHKLGGQPASDLALLSDRSLTRIEAIYLHTLRNGDPSYPYGVVAVFLILAGSAYWQPGIFAPLATAMAVAFLLPRILPIYTAGRSRWYRLAKWAMLAIAAVLPFVNGARVPWISAIFVAFIFWLFEIKRISLRRKLPIEEWPKELYL